MYLTENWRLKNQRYTLKGTQDTRTQQISFPPRKVAAREITPYNLNTTGNADAIENEISEAELIQA